MAEYSVGPNLPVAKGTGKEHGFGPNRRVPTVVGSESPGGEGDRERARLLGCCSRSGLKALPDGNVPVALASGDEYAFGLYD